MSPDRVYPSNSNRSNRSNGNPTPVSVRNTPRPFHAAPPASERIANQDSYGGGRKPENWDSLVATDPVAWELERMSLTTRR